MPLALPELVFSQPARWNTREETRAQIKRLFAAQFEDPFGIDIDDDAPELEPPEGAAVLILPLSGEALPQSMEDAFAALLPEPTRARLKRFAHPVRRQQSLLGRVLAQRLANDASDAVNGSFFLREQPPEGPRLADFEGRSAGRFAIAHTEAGIAVSLSKHPMGLDLETRRRHPRLTDLAEFALGNGFSRELAALFATDEAKAEEAFLAAWGAIESAQKMNGEDRKSAAASPEDDERMMKYARDPEAEVRWNRGLEAVDPDDKSIALEFLDTPAGLLTLLGAEKPRTIELVTVPPEELLAEMQGHVRTFL
ncbi:4'-phosphopantetheinyl transferase superfamily protein [Sutterella sp.]|uniref:4'-phosphopantetheinyl transferase family protein n=1 Tax=Sutterella sp. TaxID=1981025 RepID=UPI0026DF19DA|nr:hypothetical protein [Sutterella sp.]MDO5532136.1 hypothetical protein [Sutterella sp.]